MFSFIRNMLCFGFRIWHEFESYLYDEMCMNDQHSNKYTFHAFGKDFEYDRSNKIFKWSWLLWIPSMIIGLIGTLYGLYRLTRFSEKSIFGSMLTAECVAKDVNLTGKVAIVTGASDGLGKEVSKVLLKQGACVIMGVRDRIKGEETRQFIIDYLTSKNYQSLHTLEKRIIILSLDLTSLSSIKDFVINFNKLGLPLHYLINNAGIMSTPYYELSKDGIENQFQINYLSHYYLTRLLLPILMSTPNSRIVNLSSTAFNAAPKPFSEWIDKHSTFPQGPLKDEYSSQGFIEYGIANASMVLFTRELEKRYKETKSVSVHPGNVDTELWNRNKWFKRLRYGLLKWLKYFPGEFKSVEQGAGAIMSCIVKPNDEIKSGYFYRDCECANDKLRNDLLNNYNQQEEKLWNLSENLIKKAGFDFSL